MFPQISFVPAVGGNVPTWVNLPGQIINKGLELSLNGTIIDNDNVTWNLAGNATFIKNKVQNISGIIKTGALNGQGLSGVTTEVIQNGLPLFAMVTREYNGLDANGFSKYTDDGFTNYYVGNPNPKVIMGLSTNVRYKKILIFGQLQRRIWSRVFTTIPQTRYSPFQFRHTQRIFCSG